MWTFDEPSEMADLQEWKDWLQELEDCGIKDKEIALAKKRAKEMIRQLEEG